MQTLHELLGARGLYVRCPSCDEAFSVRKARLFDVTKPLPDYARQHLAEQRSQIAEESMLLRSERAELKRRSFTSAVSSGIGQTLEMVAASLPGLPTAGQDCRALLKPLDYVAFVGASVGKVEAIRFIEVKTGQQRLSAVQRAIRTAVAKGAVKLRIADHRVCIK
ncbi:MAG: Holliday junction resolvase-like protein [Gammaproteobacteria bacterium]|nr:Holliday junction resolvase-like protein [Gammaproteobacteria bacterium]